jgi:type IV secretion system protein VirB10
MRVAEIGDPRLKALFGTVDPRSSGVRPLVRLRRSGPSPLMFGVAAIVAGAVLFCALNERSTSQQEPAASAAVRDGSRGAWQAPPPLYVPPVGGVSLDSSTVTVPHSVEPEPAHAGIFTPAPLRLHVPAERSRRPQFALEAGRPALVPAEPRSSGAALLIDHTGGGAQTPGLPPILGVTAGPAAQDLPETGRVRATSLANPSLTVPQGTLIAAVLETGFNSTKPSFARAVVSRDVRGFDGKAVLIPRGSRLIGEGRSPAAEGQTRAIITWTRLILPDGTTINIGSPTGDTVGSVGVQASVNTHFLSRVGDALGRTILDLGRAFIGRSGPLVLLSGGDSSGQSRLVNRSTRAPTLKLAPGTSISVFVARDLEFSSAGGQE